MIVCFWNFKGEFYLEILPRGTTVNTSFFTKCLVVFRNKFPSRQILLHMDNAKPHTLQYTNSMLFDLSITKIMHPPYSPDLAPSDFFLFSYVKERLKKTVLPEDSQEQIQVLSRIIESITKEQPDKVFEEWKKRCVSCIQENGEYFH